MNSQGNISKVVQVILVIFLTLFGGVQTTSANDPPTCVGCRPKPCFDPKIPGCIWYKEKSDSNSGTYVATGVAIGIGIATYLFIRSRNNDQKEQLRLLNNYYRGNGIRLTSAESHWSVDVLDSGSQFNPGINGHAANNFISSGENTGIYVGLVTVRY